MVDNKPWKRQRVLKAESIPSQQTILLMAKSFSKLEEQALFILTYLTAGRISEVVPRRFLYKNIYLHHFVDGEETNKLVMKDKKPVIVKREKIMINYEGIRKKDIVQTIVAGKNVLEVHMANRKHRKHKRKVVPIPIDREPLLIDILRNYVSKLDEEDPLFSFTVGKARNILATVDMNPHFLRDIRLTHMVTMYGFNVFQLVRFAGWTTISPAERYVMMSTKDLVVNY